MKKALMFFGLCLITVISVSSHMINSSEKANITITIESIFEENNIITTTMSQSLGSTISITPIGHEDYQFSFWIVNGVVRTDLPENHTFMVSSKMEIVAVFHKLAPLTHTVLFIDANGKIIDIQFVLHRENAVDPSSSEKAIVLPTKPGYTYAADLWKTNNQITSLENITQSCVYALQYTSDNAFTFLLEVIGGSGSGSYGFNEIATISANPNPEGFVFSHWEEDGMIVSYESSFAFTMLGNRSMEAIYSPTAIVSEPLITLSSDLELRSNYRSYIGQFYIPSGYTLIEYGLLRHESDVIVDINTAGVVQLQSNVYNQPTNEFLMSLHQDNHRSVCAYMIVKNGVGEIEYYYSQRNITYATVLLDYNGGEADSAALTVVLGQTYDRLPIPTRENHIFCGWATTNYDAIETMDTVQNGSNHTLTAQWMSEGLTFSAVNGGYAVAKGTATASHIEVPAIYQNQKVVSVASLGFSSMSSLETIDLPETIKLLGNSSFSSSSNLSTISLPNSLSEIGDNVFSYCHSLAYLFIPNRVESIGEYALRSMSAIIEFAEDSIIDTIGYRTFYYYGWGFERTTLTLPDSVINIENEAFDNAYLTNIEVTSNLLYVGYKALGTRWFGAQPTGFAYLGNVLCGYIGSLPENGELVVPSNTISIAGGAFYQQATLKKVTLLEGILSIGENAFNGCSILEDINFPHSLQSIGVRAFGSCGKLKVVTLLENVVSVEYNAFEGCNNLEQVYVARSEAMGITSIPSQGWNLDNFAIYVPSDSVSAYRLGSPHTNYIFPINCIDVNGYAIVDNQLIQYVGQDEHIVVPEGITSLRNYVFKNKNASSIMLPASLVTIGFDCFVNATGTIMFAEGNQIQSIPYRAFNHFKGTAINLPSTVQTIGDEAFYYCENLVSMTIPQSVISIGNNAFPVNRQLQELHLLRHVDHGITTIGTNPFDHTLHANLKIYAEDEDSVIAYQNAANWSSYASRIYIKP